MEGAAHLACCLDEDPSLLDEGVERLLGRDDGRGGTLERLVELGLLLRGSAARRARLNGRLDSARPGEIVGELVQAIARRLDVLQAVVGCFQPRVSAGCKRVVVRGDALVLLALSKRESEYLRASELMRLT